MLRVLDKAGPDEGRRPARRTPQHRRRVPDGARRAPGRRRAARRRSTSSATRPSTARRAARPSSTACATTRPICGRRPTPLPTRRRPPPSGSSSKFWARAQIWVDEHPKEWIEGYYVKDQGLTARTARTSRAQAGSRASPRDWDPVIERQQKTVDLLAKETGQEKFDAEILFDRRFESVGAERPAEAAGADGTCPCVQDQGEAVHQREHRRPPRPSDGNRAPEPAAGGGQAPPRPRAAPSRTARRSARCCCSPSGRPARQRGSSTRGTCRPRGPWSPRRATSSQTAGSSRIWPAPPNVQGSGLLFGIAAGLLLALLSGLSRTGEGVIDGPVQIKRAIPSLALIPLLILWFGIGETMKVITIALAVLVPIYIHTHNGLRTIDSRYVELAETVRLTRRQFVRQVVLPGALPGFLLGLRFAVTAPGSSLVVVEQINATSGHRLHDGAGPHVRADRDHHRRPGRVRASRPRSRTDWCAAPRGGRCHGDAHWRADRAGRTDDRTHPADSTRSFDDRKVLDGTRPGHPRRASSSRCSGAAAPARARCCGRSPGSTTRCGARRAEARRTTSRSCSRTPGCCRGSGCWTTSCSA